MEKTNIIEKLNAAGITKSYVLAIFYNKACLGYFENNEIYFYNTNIDYESCKQMRFFNQDAELRIISENGNTYSKLITDDNHMQLKDEYMFLTGDTIETVTDRFTVVEQQGRIIEIPLVLNQDEVKKGIRLIVRNYLETDENHQVTISDSRLVGFSKTREGKEVL